MGKQVLKRKDKIVVPAEMRQEALIRLKKSLPENVKLTTNARLEELLAYGYMQQAGVIFDKNETRTVTIGDGTKRPDIVCDELGVEVTARGYSNECVDYGRIDNYIANGLDHKAMPRDPKSPNFFVVPLMRKQNNYYNYGDTNNSLYIESTYPSNYHQLSEAQKALVRIQNQQESCFDNLICKVQDELYLINKHGIDKTTVQKPDWDFSGYQEMCDYYDMLTGYISNKRSRSNNKGKKSSDFVAEDFAASMSR